MILISQIKSFMRKEGVLLFYYIFTAIYTGKIFEARRLNHPVRLNRGF